MTISDVAIDLNYGLDCSSQWLPLNMGIQGYSVQPLTVELSAIQLNIRLELLIPTLYRQHKLQ